MRHRVAHRKLGRVTEHRLALLRNQAEALIRHEHIRTTVPKAKELRPYVERIISIAKRGVTAAQEGGGAGGNGRMLHARRLVLREVRDGEVVSKLFDTIAPRFATRPGGYTRLLRLGRRRGDAAELAQVELVGSEFDPKAVEKAPKTAAEAPKRKTVGGRLRAAAQRMRGKKSDTEMGDADAKRPERMSPGTRSRAAQKTPQKKGT